ncbi:MFS transporter [Actinoallomurus purpureus]|uniref:MFS transporter n=1 Tax=Actinoallomurus purpureus TaxID=478114 RepID=UPI00209335C9|nr:MFS transporter [Actinoallomurus purpureus]MCO6009063.1 MFS transporter [Actinoallomurus purpureus]
MESSRRWWTLTGVALATFMTYLDNNVVNVALPSIQRDLHLTLSGLEWIVSSYILVFSGLMLVGGRLGDVFGRRRVFLAGLTVFTAASLLAGIASDETTLIVARVLQGVGAAAAAPSTMAIISSIFPDPRERTKAVSVWSAVGALALALGPLTGGFISDHWHWGWIFLINVPVGVVTIAIFAFSTRESGAAVRRRLDVPGLLASAIALFSVTYALIEGHDRGWTSPLILGAFALAAVAAAAFIVVETRTGDAMVDLSMFRERVFSGGLGAMVLWGFGVMGVYLFTAMYLQNILGFSPTKAGASIIPMAVMMIAMAPFAGTVARRLGTHVTVAAGLALNVVGMVMVSFVGEGGGFLDLLPAFIAFGVGSGFTMLPLTDAVIGVLPPARAGAASGVLNAAREVSGLLGVTIIGAILTSRQSAVLRGGSTPTHAFLSGYQLALLVGAAIVFVGVPLSLYTLRTRREAPVDAQPILQPIA